MGRRAKHRTAADKHLAAKTYNFKYNQSPIAKLRRQQQNHDAYQRRISKAPSPTNLPVFPVFPTSLHRRAISKLRSTSHFHHAYHALSPPALILGIWQPEYLPIIAQDTSQYDPSTYLDIFHTTNGNQLKLLEASGHGRRKLSTDNKANEMLVQAMLDEIEVRLGSWIDRDQHFEQFEGSEWEIMVGELALEWGARVLYCLKDEVRVRSICHTNYLEAYENKQLAWQSVDVIE